ncbi:MAG: lysophospholipid acyltransferase family protein [Gemmatimonadaceae bacterium]
MIYDLLKWVAGIALHWFYRDIRVVGRERIPIQGPLLIAVNHQNALVDSLIAGWVIPRRITMTAKATLTRNPLIAVLFKVLRVVPLRRVSDETARSLGGSLDPARNADAFRELFEVLKRNGAVLIFPEGKSHNETGLEPLRTGLARVALQARNDGKIDGIRIVPLGLVFEDKGTPGTVVGARVGKVIDLDTWMGEDPSALTAEIANRLRVVSESAGLPSEMKQAPQKLRPIRDHLIATAAWWGRLTHRLPIRLARSFAIHKSTNADEPAMFTILFGLGLVLLTYAVHLTIIEVLLHSVLVGCLYLATLIGGAYWAAFESRPRGRH